ncbi:MAG: carbohydrate ABC transporter substrate-binding protein, partial [Bacteroidota bacterium]
SILGGTGLAISKKCKNKDHALNFSLYCCSSIVQKGIYTYAGGQPAHLEAWESNELNNFNKQFFTETLTSHKHAIVRPRYSGYVGLQESIGLCLQQYLKSEKSIEQTWRAINELYNTRN